MQARITFFFIIILLIAAGCSQSKTPNSIANISLAFESSPPTLRMLGSLFQQSVYLSYPPANILGFSCYGVNVMGSGISPASRAQDFQNLSQMLDAIRAGSTCSYPGVTSSPISRDATVEVDLVVPTGNSRIIQVVGIQDPENQICNTPFPLGDVAGTSQNQGYYEIGRTIIDLFADTSVTIVNGYDTLQPEQQASKRMDCGTSSSIDYRVVVTGPVYVPAGSCVPYYIETRDSGGSPKPTTVAEPVTLTNSGTGIFYASSNCLAGTEIISTSIPASTSSTVIYFKPTTPGTEVLTATPTSTGWISGGIGISVTSPATQLVFSQSPSVITGGCNGPFVVDVRNGSNAGTVVTESTLVQFSTISDVTATYHMSSDCSDTGTSTISEALLPGSGVTQPYYVHITNGGNSVTLSASATGLTSATYTRTYTWSSCTSPQVLIWQTNGGGYCDTRTPYNADAFENPQQMAQSFRPSVPMNITGLTVNFEGYNPTTEAFNVASSVSMKVTADASGIPGAQFEAGVTHTINAGSGFMDYTYTLSTPQALTAGTDYWILILGTDSAQGVVVNCAATDNYPDGAPKYYNLSSGWSSFGAKDFGFTIRGCLN